MESAGADMDQPPWQVVIHADLAAVALAVARDVATRLRGEARLNAAYELAIQQSAFPYLIRNHPSRISAGHAGLATLYAVLDHSFPAEGWDVAGHCQLERAARSVGGRDVSEQPLSLFSGLSGMALAIWLSSHNGARYRKLLTTIERRLFPIVIERAAQVLAACPHGCAASLYDIVSGFAGAGAGAYLLCRAFDQPARHVLQSVLAVLVSLSAETDGLLHCHVPPEQQLQDTWAESYPDGHTNCGLAHGIPGPLALLSLARRAGVEVPGIDEAIAHIADWLVAHCLEDEWGINWPAAWPVGRFHAAPTTRRSSRTAWCYGTPGVARALWLAGSALGCAQYQKIALEGMQAVYRQPLPVRRIDSPSFCHGVAGLLQITLRFANESDDPCFEEAATILSRQLLDLYQPEALPGYRHLESQGVLVDHPWLLNGAVGVALVLLAAASPGEPAWDRLFVLS